MITIIISKVRILRECSDMLSHRYGIDDYDDLLDQLGGCIKDHYTDRKRIHELVYGKLLFTPNPIPSQELLNKLFIFLMDLRYMILDLLHEQVESRKKHSIRFVRTNSKLSLSFRIFD